METGLLYFADPMCSWCWGFVPTMKQVRERFDAETPIRLFVGGLATGIDKPLGNNGKQEIESHWREVAHLTGQPFDHEFFERENFIYNSEMPSYAIVAVRNANLNAGYFLEAVQRAFYEHNKDITDVATLVEIAGSVGLDKDSFAQQLAAPETKLDAEKDFELTKKLGLQGFPALLGMANNKIELLTMGYESIDVIAPKVEAWIQQSQTTKQ